MRDQALVERAGGGTSVGGRAEPDAVETGYFGGREGTVLDSVLYRGASLRLNRR
jgi:hypothetical protein